MRARTRELLRGCASCTRAPSSRGGRAPTWPRGWTARRCTYVVGNHGLEPAADLGALRGARCCARLLPLRSRPRCRSRGVDIEDKRYSLAVHYRRSRRKRAARPRFRGGERDAADAACGSCPGKCVVNLVPSRAPNKGDALLELASARAPSGAVRRRRLHRRGRLPARPAGAAGLGAGGRSSRSSASCFLETQRDMDSLVAPAARSARLERCSRRSSPPRRRAACRSCSRGRSASPRRGSRQAHRAVVDQRRAPAQADAVLEEELGARERASPPGCCRGCAATSSRRRRRCRPARRREGRLGPKGSATAGARVK